VVDDSLNSLAAFRKQLHYRATPGSLGGGSNRHGSNGADLEIRVCSLALLGLTWLRRFTLVLFCTCIYTNPFCMSLPKLMYSATFLQRSARQCCGCHRQFPGKP
jgi:hypothetical protein